LRSWSSALKPGLLECRGVGAILLAGVVGAGCARREEPVRMARVTPPAAAENGPTSTIDPRYGTSASPRVVDGASRVPKGGGSYKIGTPYQIAGRWYVPRHEPGYDRDGIASFYAHDFHGRKTANGEIFDMHALTAAHPTLPLPSYAYVTNIANGRTVLVRINDRGPYAHDRIIDLSRRTASELGFERQGLTRVRVRYAGPAPLDGNDDQERRHLAAQPWSRFAGLPAAAQPNPAPAPTFDRAPPHPSADLPSGLTWRR
jgi:rare lipoprotein A